MTLQKLASFIEDSATNQESSLKQKMSRLHLMRRDRKLSRVAKDDKVLKRLCSLFFFHRQPGSVNFGEFYRKYEDAVLTEIRRVCSAGDMILGQPTPDKKQEQAFLLQMENPLCYAVMMFCINRSIFETDNGRVGIAGGNLQLGDHLIIIPGIGTPYLARKNPQNQWILLDGAFVPGIMHGELFQHSKMSEAKWMEFC